MKAGCNETPIMIEKILASGGLEPGNARSEGQRLIHCATGTPETYDRFSLSLFPMRVSLKRRLHLEMDISPRKTRCMPDPSLMALALIVSEKMI